ncbi:clustered with transcription termination protein NusA [Agrilactobacillus composti DSM 18527 = JCM 14202]|uniref:ribosome maturation factor RimP n=1 Tax=Agrilactobacillus composti TaxID=398555 RepID=UPI00042DF350|nr:ribosome maturation factor RimP [Agrilactobacillus composti]GAF41214.1 clustered with transcription termination protein NusA [Agrilactobacillus composti DSM 18527 = JCM 14202]
MSNVVTIVENIVQPIVDSYHFQLVDVAYEKEGRSWYLRVYIDKPGGIDIEECALVSEKLSEKLDVLEPDPFDDAYFLEVSSPGAERPLKTDTDIENAVGEYIHISLYQIIDQNKVYEGTLKAVDPDNLTLEIKNKTRRQLKTFERKNIAKARLAIEF